MDLDNSQIEGASSLSAITSKRVARMQQELQARDDENQKLRATLEHSVKMVNLQDKLIADLERQSMESSPPLMLTAEVVSY
ncbi:MAG: hypothetical protein RLZZ171_2120 [Cyanobacteriota bacterium]|jgi:hypothetical protein